MLKTRSIMTAVFCGFVGAWYIVCPVRAFAQAAPGPLPQAQSQQAPPAQASTQHKEQQPARTSIVGFWKLNRDESDDPRKKLEQARSGNGTSGGRRRSGGGYPFPGGGGGGGPYGGRRQRNGGQNGGEGRRQGLLFAPGSLTIEQKEAEVDLTDDQYHKVTFYTDGRKIQKSKDERLQEAAARWDSGELISDEKTPQGGKMSRSFKLSVDGQQLYETLRLETARSKSPLVLRYVFDAAKQDAR